MMDVLPRMVSIIDEGIVPITMSLVQYKRDRFKDLEIYAQKVMPLYEGVTLCLLTAMSLLAVLGLRHPVKLLPVLLFESLWKLLWLSLVALPKATTGDLDAATTDIVMSCSLVVVILAVTPWRYVWNHYVRTTGDRWR